MMSDAEDEARADWEVRQNLAQASIGTVTAVDLTGESVTVTRGGMTRSMPWVGDAPWVGDRVLISVVGKQARCQVVHGAPLGTIVSATSTIATVSGDDGTIYAYPFVSGTEFVSGDRVALDHRCHLVAARLSTNPPPPDESPFPPQQPPPPQPTTHSADFYPKWSGSWWNGTYNSANVNVGSTTLGAYGYGRQIPSSVPSGATITAASLHLEQILDHVPGVASLMGTHAFADDSHPGTITNANVTGSTAVSGGTQDINLAGSAILAALLSASAFGIAFRSGQSYREFGQSPSGRIHLEWQA